MKKIFWLVSLTVVCALFVLALSMAVAYSVQSLSVLPFSLCSWQSWLIIAVVYVVLCAIVRGIYELAIVVRDKCEHLA